MKITPNARTGGHRTGSLSGYTKDQIDRALGFAPNVADDPYKVKYSWGATVELDGETHHIAIWDYKGSHAYNEWSTYGPAHVLTAVFATFPILS